MSIESILNAMRRETNRATWGERAACRLGIVTSYNKVKYQAKVQIQPENLVTGWLPILSGWIGNQWGVFCPPSVGDQVEVQFQEDDINGGFICNRFFTDLKKPVSVDSGEFWIVHQTGTYLKMTNDKQCLINAAEHLKETAPTIDVVASDTYNETGTNSINEKSDTVINSNAPTININGSETVNVVGTTAVNINSNLAVNVTSLGLVTVTGATGVSVISPDIVAINGTGGVNITTAGNAIMNITGNVTGTIQGNLTTNVTGNIAYTSPQISLN